jgi:cysteinyl-tRNA synthetase
LEDLNTPKAIAEIHRVLSYVSEKIKDFPDFSTASLDVLSILKTIDWFDRSVLKLNLLDSAIKELKTQQQIPEEIRKLAEKRWQAKLEKNYTLADEIREQIRAKGYEVLDLKDGFKIIKK